MPLVLLRAFAQEMPRLQARESISMANIVALGMGNMDKDDARRLQDDWRAVTGPTAAAAAPSPDFLASHGIGFSRERPGS